MNLLALMTQQGYINEANSITLAQKVLQDKLPELEVIQQHVHLQYREIASIISRKTLLPLLNLQRIVAAKLPPTLVDAPFLKNLDALPLARRNDRLVLAMSNPLDKQVIKKIQERLKLQLDIVVVAHDDLLDFFNKSEKSASNENNPNQDAKSGKNEADEKTSNVKKEAQLHAQIHQQLQKSSINILYEEARQNTSNTLKRTQSDIDDAPVVRFLQKILQQAVDVGASDLHFEPFEETYRIRFRIDGILHEVSTPPADIKEKLATRIKVLSRLDIAEKRIPQDGRMKIILDSNVLDLEGASAAQVGIAANGIGNTDISGNISANITNGAAAQLHQFSKNNFMQMSAGLNAGAQLNQANYNNYSNANSNANSNNVNDANYSTGVNVNNVNNSKKANVAGNEKKSIDFRVSTLPTLFGEKIVIRILENNKQKLNIDELGYEAAQKQTILDAIARPYGMILVTGPTGSGKTISLYTFLTLLNDGAKNILSAEDPAEIQVTGINQVNINEKAGLTFAASLRSFLRQDPDIIMVGEIRDLETADIAVKAAQTGHLVLSTLHTNDAPSTLVRLMNMGVQAFNIASSVHLITAQRLVRKLCKHCRAVAEYDTNALKEAGFTDAQINQLHEDYAHYHSSHHTTQHGNNTHHNHHAHHRFSKLPHKATGCHKCNHTGYKGRMGIYQVLPITDSMREIILRHGTSLEIAEQAAKEGVLNLRQSGLLKVCQGTTSLEEILGNTNI